MHAIPTFRTDAEAAHAGRLAALDGDNHRLHLSMIALSHRLFIDRPQLFDVKKEKA